MIESVEFKCSWCGKAIEASFDIPDDSDLQIAKDKGYQLRYIPKMTDLYCESCNLYFRRGISVLQNTWIKEIEHTDG